MAPKRTSTEKFSRRSGRRLRVGVVFGGRSTEHEVSLVSATSIINALDPRKYTVVPIGITPEGKWLSGSRVLGLLKAKGSRFPAGEQIILPEPSRHGLVPVGAKDGGVLPIDVIFPVIHGTYGEDGTIQGLFELAGIPYVGAGVLGSSAGMDKVVTKQLCEMIGIRVTPYVWFLSGSYRTSQSTILKSIERLKYPVFVKPANGGSSVGITKAHNRRELIRGIRTAMRYDRKILVEKSIEGAREIEVSVLGNDDPEISVPGEIISSNEFYDYDAKYVDGKSDAVIPAPLTAQQRRQVGEYARRGFLAIDCAGMARIDFLLERKSGTLYLNEINTIPGFTSISMYPKLWEASGLSYPQLLDRLIRLAFERHARKNSLETTYKVRKAWYNG